MKRFFVQSVAALCLLLCLSAVLAWVGSYSSVVTRAIGLGPSKELLSYRGQILFYHWHTAFYTGFPGVPWRYGGFYYYNQRFLCVSVPHWSLAVTFATIGGLMLRWQRHAKWHAGYCTTCGYDLRASAERLRSRQQPPHNPTMQRIVPAGKSP